MSSKPKIQIVALSLALCAAFAGRAAAQGANAATATKIAIISIQDAIVSTNEGKKEFDALQTKYSPKKASLEKQNTEVEDLKKQYDARVKTLSPEASAS